MFAVWITSVASARRRFVLRWSSNSNLFELKRTDRENEHSVSDCNCQKEGHEERFFVFLAYVEEIPRDLIYLIDNKLFFNCRIIFCRHEKKSTCAFDLTTFSRSTEAFSVSFAVVIVMSKNCSVEFECLYAFPANLFAISSRLLLDSDIRSCRRCV